MIDAVDGEHRKLNEPPELYVELDHHFKINCDEQCLLASSGVVMIVGAADKRKHEKETSNSRCSIASLESGSAAGSPGSPGPTLFLTTGQSAMEGFHPEFLVENGAATGSRVIPTPTGTKLRRCNSTRQPAAAHQLGMAVLKEPRCRRN